MFRNFFLNLQRQRDKDTNKIANKQYFKRINFSDYGKQERNKAVQHEVYQSELPHQGFRL
jgi:hypothetical protein